MSWYDEPQTVRFVELRAGKHVCPTKGTAKARARWARVPFSDGRPAWHGR